MIRAFASPTSSTWPRVLTLGLIAVAIGSSNVQASDAGNDFFEKRVRPLLVNKCYECHSEQAGEQQGGLLLDRQAGWLEGGDTNKAVIPGQPEASLLLAAVRYQKADLQMPPDEKLADHEIELLEQWIQQGAPGPADDMGETEFSKLGDQAYLLNKATQHWAFQPLGTFHPPPGTNQRWNQEAIDKFVSHRMAGQGLLPSPRAAASVLARRLYFDLTGLPPTIAQVNAFVAAAEQDFDKAIQTTVDHLINDPAFGQHFARLWLDVARYADTDSAYRPDTRTPHYFPFAFTYRDYVVDAFNNDKPFDQFILEQFAADLIGFKSGDPEIAALGFFGVGPHANRAQTEALDDWIDVTTRGLMGLTVACARCHDHKYEPVPTADYYSLRGVFASVRRLDPLDEQRQPIVGGYEPAKADRRDYEQKRAAIEKKIEQAGNKKSGGNNRSVAQKIRETELAELLLFHPGGPAHAMVVTENPKPTPQYIFVRGDAAARGELVPRRFVQILDQQQSEFAADASGRLDLAKKIVNPSNPLTARVFVNRVWGYLIGSHLVFTPSDFGFQGIPPTHPELLDWLAADFIAHGWSIKHLARRIVLSETYAQHSKHRERSAAIDPENKLLWRANRKHLSIEMIRDSLLAVAGRLDRTQRGRPAMMWGDDYTKRRAIYGYINRFNLDPTLRAFDFPTPMQSQPKRVESIVALQALFTMNSPFVADQAKAIVDQVAFRDCRSDQQRIEFLFRTVLQRNPVENEIARVQKFVSFQTRFQTQPGKPTRFVDSPWPLLAQSLMMSNEFQYID